MPASDEESPPMEYIPSASGRRRSPKKLHNIGLEQFKSQGGLPKFLPGSAAARLHEKKVDQRVDTRFGRGPTTQSVGGLMGGGRAKVESGGGDQVATATSLAVGDAVRGASGSLDTFTAAEDALFDDTKQKQKHDTTTVASMTQSRNSSPIIRRIKASPGRWGNHMMENSKRAAQKAAAPQYLTTPIDISVDADGELIATVKPTPVIMETTSQPPPVQTKQFDGIRKVHTQATRRWAQRNGSQMDIDGYDDESQDEEEFDGRLVPSGSTRSATRRPTPRRQNLSSSGENTPDLDTSSKPNKKTSRPQAAPQQKRVRFASPFTSSEADQTTLRTTNNATPLTPSSSSPSHIKENLDPGEISDDEDSELYHPSKLPLDTEPESTSSPEFKPERNKPQKQQQQNNPVPSRKKGIATPPAPKRARAPSPDNGFVPTPDIKIDDCGHFNNTETNDINPTSKRTKLDTPTSSPFGESQPSSSAEEKRTAPFRKKGIARKVVRKK